jgi:hypothetical protein
MVQPGGGGVLGARGRLCIIRVENIDRVGPMDESPLANPTMALANATADQYSSTIGKGVSTVFRNVIIVHLPIAVRARFRQLGSF